MLLVFYSLKNEVPFLKGCVESNRKKNGHFLFPQIDLKEICRYFSIFIDVLAPPCQKSGYSSLSKAIFAKLARIEPSLHQVSENLLYEW